MFEAFNSEAVRIGILAILGLTVWYLFNKTFKKIISNEHLIQHQLNVVCAELERVQALCGKPVPVQSVSVVANAEVLSAIASGGRQFESAGPNGKGGGRSVVVMVEETPAPPAVNGKCVLALGLGDVCALERLLQAGKPRHFIGVDASCDYLEGARSRIEFEMKVPSDFLLVKDRISLPLADHSVDYIECTGSLHETFALPQVLAEFRRILAPGGTVRVAITNQDSVLQHLYLGYVARRGESMPLGTGLFPVGRALSTRSYRRADFCDLVQSCGFSVREVGCQLAPLEMAVLPRRLEALLDGGLDVEHADFLRSLSIDERGRPVFQGHIAGYRALFEISPT